MMIDFIILSCVLRCSGNVGHCRGSLMIIEPSSSGTFRAIMARRALRGALRGVLRALAYIHLNSSFPLDICYLCLKRLNLSVAWVLSIPTKGSFSCRLFGRIFSWIRRRFPKWTPWRFSRRVTSWIPWRFSRRVTSWKSLIAGLINVLMTLKSHMQISSYCFLLPRYLCWFLRRW